MPLDFDDDQPLPRQSLTSSSLSSAGAIAVIAAEHDSPIDPALTAALENPRERLNLLKFEDQMVQFLKANNKQLDFPPLSSYHRLIVHRLAQRFHLEHQAVEVTGYDPSVTR